MFKPHSKPQYSSQVQLLSRGWRKGRAMHDPLMWALSLVALVLPVTFLVTGYTLTEQSLWAMLTSPLFWVLPAGVLAALVLRLHYLANSIGCVRQINFSEDGQPSPCQIDLGHRECCKHIGSDGSKTDCPYWRPELVLD